MSTDHRKAEQALADQIQAGGFAVALSGGGHRATLATLGALLAIVDRGLGPKVMQIASVSGGSITNAFVAQRTRLEGLKNPGDLDEIAAQLASTIVQKGVLTKGWIAVLVIVPVIMAVVCGFSFRLLLPSEWVAAIWNWLAAIIGFGVFFAGLLSVGHVIEWLLDLRYFRYTDPSKQSGAANQRKPECSVKLSSVPQRKVDHVLCTTDLVLGLPVYVSFQHGGMIWRRLEDRPLRIDRRGDFGKLAQTFHAGHLSIAELVRASAAFPGIPPRRLRIPRDPKYPEFDELPRVAFLADGGIWNNLGTQALREDRFLGSNSAWENNVLRPRGPAPQVPLLCFNGSAPLRPSHPWWFRLPGVALIRALLQVANILNVNTVLPRVVAMRNAFLRRSDTYARPGYADPADLVVDLSPAEDAFYLYYDGVWYEDEIRLSAPNVKKWEREILWRVRSARSKAATSSATISLAEILGPKPEPQGSFPLCGVASGDDWDVLRSSPVWKELVAREGAGSVDVSTTLGRINTQVARRLIARGYLNTYLVTLFLSPFDKNELPQLAELPQRLDRIISGESSDTRGPETGGYAA